jgi:hypothetical protein
MKLSFQEVVTHKSLPRIINLRKATQIAGRMAGVEVIWIITAADLCYGLDKELDKF